MINMTTGPVELSQEVHKALIESPIPHRSDEFQLLFNDFEQWMCNALNVQYMAVLQGSGTLANEAMIWQIKTLNSKGLILSNGEFGNRLIDQATRAELNFIDYSVEWGQRFDLTNVDSLIDQYQLEWILFVHCETSTGSVNELESIATIAEKKGMLSFVDCMSSIGSMPIDLSNITMASCSSSKGLASIPGISMVLSNIPFKRGAQLPIYFDLSQYAEKKIPFTISSNQIQALYTSVQQILSEKYWNHRLKLSSRIYHAFYDLRVIPFSVPSTNVFTFVAVHSSKRICKELFNSGLTLSYQSKYLLDRNWFQLALFGNHRIEEVESSILLIKDVLKQED